MNATQAILAQLRERLSGARIESDGGIWVSAELLAETITLISGSETREQRGNGVRRPPAVFRCGERRLRMADAIEWLIGERGPLTRPQIVAELSRLTDAPKSQVKEGVYHALRYTTPRRNPAVKVSGDGRAYIATPTRP